MSRRRRGTQAGTLRKPEPEYDPKPYESVVFWRLAFRRLVWEPGPVAGVLWAIWVLALIVLIVWSIV